MKKLTKLMTAILALSLVVAALTPVTAEAATCSHIYIASFDSDATNHVKSVSVNKKGQLVVKAKFTDCTYTGNSHKLVKKSTGMKTFTFTPTDFGNGIEGGADYYRHNYKTGKTNPKFYHYTQKDFVKQVEKYMGTSWKLVITGTTGDMVSAAIVKYNGTYEDASFQGWNENCNADEVDWARMWHCPVCREKLGYGPEALALRTKLHKFKLFCEDHEGVFYK